MDRIIRAVAAAALVAAFAGSAVAQQTGTFTDGRDGHKYKTVKIGTQTWMAENLNYKTKSGSWCYRDSASYCKKYGRLYDWTTATTVCPKGWKLPDTADWNRLVSTVGRKEIAGKKLKSKSGWSWSDHNNRNGNGTDDFGFSALPGGNRNADGSFSDVGYYGRWWTATEYDAIFWCGAYHRNMNLIDGVYGDGLGKSYGFSVRCVED